MPTIVQPITVSQRYTYWELTRLIAGGPLVYRETANGMDVKVISGAKRVYSSVSTKPWPTGHPTVWTAHSKSTYAFKRVDGYFEKFQFNSSWGWYRTVYRTGDLQMISSNSPFGGDVSLTWIPVYPSTSALSSKFRLALKSDFNAGVALAEVDKTFKLIGTNLSRIGQAFLDLKHGKIQSALSRLNLSEVTRLSPATMRQIKQNHRTKREREFAQRILETQYGWRPLVQDVYNAIELCKANAPEMKQRKSVGSQMRVDYVQSGDYLGTPYGVTLTQRYEVSGTSRRRYVVEYALSSRTLNHVKSIGLLNPAAIAWELVPGSFLVDWVLPIGDWINGLDAYVGLTFLRGVEVTAYSVTQKSRYTPKVVSNTLKGFAACESDYTAYNRVGKSDFPAVECPAFKNPLSAQHALNGLALLVSSFHR